MSEGECSAAVEPPLTTGVSLMPLCMHQEATCTVWQPRASPVQLRMCIGLKVMYDYDPSRHAMAISD